MLLTRQDTKALYPIPSPSSNWVKLLQWSPSLVTVRNTVDIHKVDVFLKKEKTKHITIGQ